MLAAPRPAIGRAVSPDDREGGQPRHREHRHRAQRGRPVPVEQPGQRAGPPRRQDDEDGDGQHAPPPPPRPARPRLPVGVGEELLARCPAAPSPARGRTGGRAPPGSPCRASLRTVSTPSSAPPAAAATRRGSRRAATSRSATPTSAFHRDPHERGGRELGEVARRSPGRRSTSTAGAARSIRRGRRPARCCIGRSSAPAAAAGRRHRASVSAAAERRRAAGSEAHAPAGVAPQPRTSPERPHEQRRAQRPTSTAANPRAKAPEAATTQHDPLQSPRRSCAR